MTLGTQNKTKVGALAVLGVVAAYTFYTNVLAGPDTSSSSRRSPATSQSAEIAAAGKAISGSTSTAPPKRLVTRSRSEEFHPVFREPNPEKRRDVTAVDPTLKLDLFSKVQGVDLAGGARNLFQFGPPPVDPNAKLALKNEPKVDVSAFVGPKQPPPPAPPPPPPPPPPITLKFYGYSTALENGKKTAYLLDGDEIYMAREGDTLKRRYKIVRIQPNSILIEDLDAKRQQSVPLIEENGSGA
jgi:hypothetical protein